MDMYPQMVHTIYGCRKFVSCGWGYLRTHQTGSRHANRHNTENDVKACCCKLMIISLWNVRTSSMVLHQKRLALILWPKASQGDGWQVCAQQFEGFDVAHISNAMCSRVGCSTAYLVCSCIIFFRSKLAYRWPTLILRCGNTTWHVSKVGWARERSFTWGRLEDAPVFSCGWFDGRTIRFMKIVCAQVQFIDAAVFEDCL